MTTAVTTKVARSWPRSPNFKNLAKGELTMWRQKLFAALGLLVGVFAVLLLAPTARAQQPGYTMTDLGPASPHSAPAWFGGEGVTTVSMNAAGDVVAASPSGSGNTHAALFHNGQVIDLGTLGGLNSDATGINKSGLIVGNSQISGGSVHAFLYSNNVMSDLGTLGGPNSYAIAINDSGQIVGNSDLADGTSHAFLYVAGVMTDLGAVSAVSINASGQILVNDSSFASVYTNGAMQPLPQPQCPGYAFQYGAAYAINDSADVVGEVSAWNGGQFVCDDAFFISGGQAKDIGFAVLPMGFNTAIAINGSGHILGKGWTYCDGSFCQLEYTFLDGAVLFYALSTPDSSGWSSLLGSAINDAGQIAGIGNNANSSGQRAFLMTPIALPTVSITYPASGAIVAGIFPVYASATDATGVAGVQFKLDGANLGAEVITAPYVISWNTTLSVGGAHVVSAVARDAAGVIGTAAPVNVTVDNVLPSVSITAPASGAMASGTITVSASATDNVGVVGVQFKLDGANLGTEVTTASYAISWNTASVPNGVHTLTAVAHDAAGNTATSSAVTVHVRNHR
jgi:probable HAF family extracellular repeat protein